MAGTFIPPWYQYHEPTCDDLAIVSIVFGLSVGLIIFAVIRASNQTYHQWKRARRVTTYMVLIWLELIASSVIGGLSWGYVKGSIRPGFKIYFFILFLWVFQIHCIMQIIINRIALLAISPTTVRRLKWGVFIILALINISVFCIWIPARLQISQTYIRINGIWDRIEKAIFAIIDMALNFYFVYLVRSSLISYGLTKYVTLYRFNLVMVAISLTMDVLIIATMSLKNTFIYVQFHPLAYLIKLHIELSMAELIAKVVKASRPDLSACCLCHENNHNHNHTPFFSHELNPQYAAPGAPQRIAPTTGRFRRSWPGWSTRRSHEKHQIGNNPKTPPVARNGTSWKPMRADKSKPRPHSWIPRRSSKDSNCASSSFPSPKQPSSTHYD